MASYSRRERNSRTRRSSRSRVHDTHSVHNVDEDPLENTCIDLTVDAPNEDVIDLTRSFSVIDSSVVVLPLADDIGLERRRGSGRRGRRRSRTPRSRRPEVPPLEVHVLHSDDSSDELPDIPFEVPQEVVSANASLLKSPEGVKISCPICLDDIKQIQRSNRQVMSTICGHIFCDVCIKAAIASQNVCPSCRKRLTVRNIHPLFL
ncbi:DNA fragmentation factor subunit alpha [Biomphalaria glabrata]|uniref:E3 ubiquitin-protein ligase RNF4-like isoform X2 n=1 Tax=Biomphalaria glabrata TaxID=6526 RepID=A0A9U8DUX8_BIOGL|nr:E3 ubiquitin-protein ligase RNF4-like isoform X2 [Biomphalaria glabrata]KAI8769859.1 hypothetical protein BgiMline_001882 [Biomphalaria glabrata]